MTEAQPQSLATQTCLRAVHRFFKNGAQTLENYQSTLSEAVRTAVSQGHPGLVMDLPWPAKSDFERDAFLHHVQGVGRNNPATLLDGYMVEAWRQVLEEYVRNNHGCESAVQFRSGGGNGNRMRFTVHFLDAQARESGLEELYYSPSKG